MLWIPVTLAAAFLQNIRSALQKILKSQLSDMGATYVRFVYAWPFAIAFLALLVLGFDISMPRANLAFVLWVIAASVSQIINTFLLLWLFSFSNFAVGTAYSKTEVVQVAMLELILLDQTTSWIGAGAIVLSTIGVLVISAGKAKLSPANLARGLGQKSTLIGLTCGLVLGASAVLFRGATLALEHESVLAKAGLHGGGRYRTANRHHDGVATAPRTWPNYTGHAPMAHGRCRWLRWLVGLPRMVHRIRSDQRSLRPCIGSDRTGLFLPLCGLLFSRTRHSNRSDRYRDPGIGNCDFGA